MSNLEVARIIQQQIGNPAFAMIGAKDFVGGPNFLRFRIGRNAKTVTHIHVILTPDDLYTVEFWSKRNHGLDCQKLSEEEGVYAEDLRSSIERNTGLYTRL